MHPIWAAGLELGGTAWSYNFKHMLFMFIRKAESKQVHILMQEIWCSYPCAYSIMTKMGVASEIGLEN